MPAPHRFADSLAVGQRAETLLDRYFIPWFTINSASYDDQRRGIDRYFTGRVSGKRFTVEYKADERAHLTGNAFIETVSVDSAEKAGWAYTSEADMLVYLMVKVGFGWCLHMRRLRARLPEWSKSYPTGRAQNDGYASRGLLVPISEIERLATRVVQL